MTNVAMERSTMFNGKIHYFDWAIFNSYVTNYQRVMLINGLFMVYSWIIIMFIVVYEQCFFSSIDGVLMFYLVYKPPNSDNL